MEKPTDNSPYTGKQVQILSVAERLFAERGYEGTSVRDIAQDANVNVAMISYYFGSKEKLMHAVFSHRIAAGRILLEHLVSDKEMHPIEKIETLVDTMVDRMMQHKSFHRMMLRAQLGAENQDVTQLLNDTKQKNLELLNKIIAEGQRKKVFVRGTDAAMLLMTVVGTVYQAASGSFYFQLFQVDTSMTEEERNELAKKKLKTHLKRILKATLTYEGK